MEKSQPPQALPPRTLDYAPGGGGKRWHVGTLTYTTAGLVVLFFWLLFGDFALAMRDRTVMPVGPLILKKFEASDTAISIMIAVLPPALSVFIGPIVSFKSDRFRSRWGRRIPFLLVPTPVAALAMVGLAFSPQLSHKLHAALDGSSPGLHACFLIVFGLFWTLFEIAAVAAAAIIGALINDVVPRPVLGRFYGLFRAVSLVAGMIFNGFVFRHAEQHFTWIFIGVGTLFLVGFTVMCLKVKEGEYPPPEPLSDDPRAAGPVAAAEVYFKESFSLSYYWWVFGAMLMATLTFLPYNTFQVPYSRALKMEQAAWGYGELVALSYGISLVLAYPIGVLVDRFHSTRVGLAAMILYAIATLYGYLFVRDAVTFGVALVAHTVLSGTYFTATASLGQALFPRMKFGQYASAAGILASVGQVALGFALGPILDASHSDYRLTFLFGFVLCLSAIVLLFVVYRNFMALGGPKTYIAPGDESDPTAGQPTTVHAARH